VHLVACTMGMYYNAQTYEYYIVTLVANERYAKAVAILKEGNSQVFCCFVLIKISHFFSKSILKCYDRNICCSR